MGNQSVSYRLCCDTTINYQNKILNFIIERNLGNFGNFFQQNLIRFNSAISQGRQQSILLDEQRYLCKIIHKEINKNYYNEYFTQTTYQYFPDFILLIVENNSRFQNRKKGMIIKKQMIYLGQIQNQVPNGQGIIYYFDKNSCSIKCQVIGKWVNNEPIELKFCHQNCKIPILSINFLNGQELAKLTFHNKLTYLGSIQFKNITQLESIMTGKGVINFPNKDVYNGQVKNGLMHTQKDFKATYSSKSNKTSYYGEFKKGFRQGFGELIFPIQGQSFHIRCLWKKGKIIKEMSLQRKLGHVQMEIQWPEYLKTAENSEDMNQ